MRTIQDKGNIKLSYFKLRIENIPSLLTPSNKYKQPHVVTLKQSDLLYSFLHKNVLAKNMLTNVINVILLH